MEEYIFQLSKGIRIFGLLGYALNDSDFFFIAAAFKIYQTNKCKEYIFVHIS